MPDRCGRLSGGAGKDARLAAAPFRQATQGEQARGRGARTRPAQAATHAGDHSTRGGGSRSQRSEEHTSELQSLMRISYAVFCLKKKNKNLKSDKSQQQDDNH